MPLSHGGEFFEAALQARGGDNQVTSMLPGNDIGDECIADPDDTDLDKAGRGGDDLPDDLSAWRRASILSPSRRGDNQVTSLARILSPSAYGCDGDHGDGGPEDTAPFPGCHPHEPEDTAPTLALDDLGDGSYLPP